MPPTESDLVRLQEEVQAIREMERREQRGDEDDGRAMGE